MIERRVSREDEISRGGKVYRRLGNIVEFESLFHSAEVERAERRRGQKAGTSGIMPVPQLPATGASRAESSKRNEVSVPPQLRVTPPGLTPAAGAMNPLRLTPSGQPPRPRPPVPAVPILQIPEATPAPAAAPAPPAPTPASTPGSAAASARYAASSPASAGTAKPTPTPPAKAAAAVASALPNKAPAAPPVSATRPAVPPRPSGTFPTERPKPAAASESEPAEAKDDSTVTDPTRRFVRLDPAPVRPVESLPVNLAPEVGTDGPKDSGNDTVAFKRAAPEDIAPDLSDDPDSTQRNPPAAPRVLARPVKSLDPVEEALRNSDPVPRHLKDPSDPNRTSRMASLDVTERMEGESGNRGLVLLVISIALAGLLIWGLRSAGTQDSGGRGTNQPVTGTGPDTPKTDEKPSGVAGSGSDAVQPGVQPSTAQPKDDGQTAGGPTKATAGSEPTAAGLGKDKPASEPEKPPATVASSGTKPETPVPSKPTGEPKPGSDTKQTSDVKPTTTGSAPATTTGSGTGQQAAPAVAKPAPQSPTAATGTAKPAPSPAGKKITVTEFPKTFDEQMDLAQRLVEHEQFDEAQRLFETILSYASHVPAVHVGLGKCALETGRTEAAIEHYNNALSKAPNYGPAIFGLAKTYRARGDKERALQNYRRYIELYPNGGAAAVARDTISRLEGNPPPAAAKPSPAPSPPPPGQSELVRPPTQSSASGSELVKPQ